MNSALAFIQSHASNPLALLALFFAASFLMVWRLHAIESKGLEGTILGTLIMPYCSGAANIAFAYIMSRGMGAAGAGNGRLVVENAIVNNVTNLTLILGLTAILCTTASATSGRSRPKKQTGAYRLDKLNLLFTLIALFLFTGTLWVLAKDRTLDFYDGLVLVGLFVFWQILHVFEILKNNIRRNKSFHWSIAFDLVVVAACAYATYLSVDHLVTWVETAESRIFSVAKLGWLSGCLMVLPNAFLAIYYSRIGRQDIVVSSQVGDGHICIPMCIGLFALFTPIQVPDYFQLGMLIILGAGAVHFLFIALLGRLPQFMGLGLIGAYGLFLYKGVFQ